MMDVLGLATLVVVGFTACAEFGSYVFFHPVFRRLPAEHHIRLEQGPLRTAGRVFPLLMPAAVVLLVVHAVFAGGEGGPVVYRWLAAAAVAVATVVTVLVNVPINSATGRWNPADPPPDWKRLRDRWERAQAVRAWLLLAGFLLLCVGFASG